MTSAERKPAVLVITENIEMELFTSLESCSVISGQETEREYNSPEKQREHPLVSNSDEEPELPAQCSEESKQQAYLKRVPSLAVEGKEDYPYVPDPKEEIEIEMEVFPPITVSERELVEIKSDHSSILTLLSPDASSNKVSHVKWRRLAPQSKGLVVKDIVCLPKRHYLTQQDRHSVPRSKERTALAAMGLSSRVTVDYNWSANQMASRLATHFKGRFTTQPGQGFSFTYLQCIQGSGVLFVPDPPAEGWTGEQVLKLCGHGSLYIVSHHDYAQAESDGPAGDTAGGTRKELGPEASTEGCREEDPLERQNQPFTPRAAEEFPRDLETILRRFRQERAAGDVESHVAVRRRALLHSALKMVRKPGFCFRTTPIVSFSGEEADGHEGPLREFFRLALLELQQSCVFEGHQGRLFLTYDLTALEKQRYYEAGVLIGWSLAQGGPGPRCLHPTLYQLMCGQNLSLEDFSWKDIADADAQIRLKQLQSCTNVKLLSAGLCDWVTSCGLPGIYSACTADLPAFYTRLVKYYIYHRVASMVTQFTEGLDSCGGLWDMMRSHWEVFVPVMTATQWRPLTLEEFAQLFTICYSLPDTQIRIAEETTAATWTKVLAMVNDGKTDFSFEDLLAFITGADHIPPLGFPSPISLRFYSQDVDMWSVRLPYAFTCALELFLPRGVVHTKELQALLSRAVHEALGFARIRPGADAKRW